VHNDFLDWFTPGDSKHPVFGKALDKQSLDLMVAISKVKTVDDCPCTPIKMISVRRRTARVCQSPRDSPRQLSAGHGATLSETAPSHLNQRAIPARFCTACGVRA